MNRYKQQCGIASHVTSCRTSFFELKTTRQSLVMHMRRFNWSPLKNTHWPFLAMAANLIHVSWSWHITKVSLNITRDPVMAILQSVSEIVCRRVQISENRVETSFASQVCSREGMSLLLLSQTRMDIKSNW